MQYSWICFLPALMLLLAPAVDAVPAKILRKNYKPDCDGEQPSKPNWKRNKWTRKCWQPDCTGEQPSKPNWQHNKWTRKCWQPDCTGDQPSKPNWQHNKWTRKCQLEPAVPEAETEPVITLNPIIKLNPVEEVLPIEPTAPEEATTLPIVPTVPEADIQYVNGAVVMAWRKSVTKLFLNGKEYELGNFARECLTEFSKEECHAAASGAVKKASGVIMNIWHDTEDLVYESYLAWGNTNDMEEKANLMDLLDAFDASPLFPSSGLVLQKKGEANAPVTKDAPLTASVSALRTKSVGVDKVTVDANLESTSELCGHTVTELEEMNTELDDPSQSAYLEASRLLSGFDATHHH